MCNSFLPDARKRSFLYFILFFWTRDGEGGVERLAPPCSPPFPCFYAYREVLQFIWPRSCYIWFIWWRVLINRAPTSSQLHPTPTSQTYLHPPHFSLHPALPNTLNVKNRNIARNWAASPNLSRKIPVLQLKSDSARDIF